MGWRELIALVQGTAVRTFANGDDQELFTYTAAGFAPVSVLGIFRDPHTYVDTRSTVQISTEQPTLDLARADLPAVPKQDDTIAAAVPRLAGKTWRVIDAQSDGEGMYKLFLVQTSP